MAPDDRECRWFYSRVCGSGRELDFSASGSLRASRSDVAAYYGSRMQSRRGIESRDADRHPHGRAGVCTPRSDHVRESWVWRSEIYPKFAEKDGSASEDSRRTRLEFPDRSVRGSGDGHLGRSWPRRSGIAGCGKRCLRAWGREAKCAPVAGSSACGDSKQSINWKETPQSASADKSRVM